jgi:hypothetical protein
VLPWAPALREDEAVLAAWREFVRRATEWVAGNAETLRAARAEAAAEKARLRRLDAEIAKSAALDAFRKKVSSLGLTKEEVVGAWNEAQAASVHES